MFKILRGNIKFYAGWKIDESSARALVAPDLDSTKAQKQDVNGEYVCLTCHPNNEMRNEIIQLMPEPKDNAKLVAFNAVPHIDVFQDNR